ncbi:MAG: TetR/AcrR family transcriptional regulator [Anaerolineae bacterium]|nr:TetR/AcrR family transcriptional regulator [Anaerolineae bacterium]
MTTQHRAEETRARILQEAAACFAQYGYDAVGIAEICRRAGVTKGGFYHHFPSKQALFLELLNRWLGGLDMQMEAARRGATTIPEALRQMASKAQYVFEAAKGQIPLYLEFWSKAARDPVVWQATIEPYRRYRDVFRGIVEAGIAEGSLQPVDPERAAQVIVALAVGLLLQGMLDPEGANWGEVMKEGIQILLSGLEKEC